MTSQGSRMDQVIKVINRLSVLGSYFYAPFVPALKLWTLLHYTGTINKKVSQKKKKRKSKEEGRNCKRTTHLNSGLSNNEAT